ncbi:MAG: hypothetical protein ACJ8FS_01360 [Sphingomicrobium sp.]
MAKRRQTDGRFRGGRQPIVVSARTLRARWVEAEVLKLKTLGVASFHAIAQQISRVGRRDAAPLMEFPPGIEFPSDYSISGVACWRACQQALARGPRLRAQEMRDIDSDRLEEGILAAQKAIKQGDTSALQSLARLITTRARLNGYLAAEQLEVSGAAGRPIEVKAVEDDKIEQMLERLTHEEAVEFLRLFNKAQGTTCATDTGNIADGQKQSNSSGSKTGDE